jgi:hypothetical protein
MKPAGLALLAALASGMAPLPAQALNTDDYAAMMGMLWRLREPICPRMSFDPEVFVKTLRLPGGSAAKLRSSRRAAFERGFAMAGEWLAQGSTPEFCAAMEKFFDGKHDFFGNPKAVPEAPLPGLTIRS